MKLWVMSGLAVVGSLALSACAPSPALLEMSAEEIRDICNRRTLTPTEIAYLRARPDFAEILLKVSDDCLAPAAIADSGGEGGGGNGGGGGGGGGSGGGGGGGEPEERS